MAQKYVKPPTPVKTTTPARPAARSAERGPVHLIFDRSNYQLLIISIVVVAFGFILMSGKTDIYGTTKTVIAPMVVLAGFALGFFAIFKKPASN
jgi:ABC-type Fe3+ transport system permease subunit